MHASHSSNIPFQNILKKQKQLSNNGIDTCSKNTLFPVSIYNCILGCIVFDTAMASGAGKSAAFIFLIINAQLCFIVIILAGWSVNHAMEKTYETGTSRLFEYMFIPVSRSILSDRLL